MILLDKVGMYTLDKRDWLSHNIGAGSDGPGKSQKKQAG